MNTDKLRIAVRKYDPFESAIDKIWKKFKHDTGCTQDIEFVAFDLHPLYEEIILKNGLKNGDWDISFINTDWIAEAVEHGHVEKLDDYMKKGIPVDYPNDWATSLLGMQEFDEGCYGFPMHNGPECLIYRKDLFDNASEKEEFKAKFGKELKVPISWDEFNEVAEFFQRPEQGLYGTVFAAYPDGHNTVFDFCLQLWTRGGELIRDDNKVVLNSKAAIEGMKYYRETLNNSNIIHPQAREFDSVKSGMAFANGEIAMMVNWFGFAPMCEVYDKSVVKGKVDVENVPAGESGQRVSLNAYWLYVLGSGSKNKQLAFDFMKYAINPENDKLMTMEGGIGCRKKTWHDDDVNKIAPYFHKLEQLHKNTRALPRMADWARIGEIIDKLVLDVINTDIDIEEILNTAQVNLDSIQN